MSQRRDAKELGRGERVIDGVYRLRLPLPWPGVPHCNAWAVAAGDGVVLFDTGVHQPGSMADLERAMDQVHLRVEHVRKVVLTHAHIDHCGQATPIAQRSGAQVWCHPNRAHQLDWETDREKYVERMVEIALQSGVPERPVRELAEQRKNNTEVGVAGALQVDHDIAAGMAVATDLGDFVAVETPGHAPSHVSFFNAEKQLLISGDHLLGRVSLFFEHGYSPDPVAEFLLGMDRIEKLDARLVLSGHGRTFTDMHGHIRANRELVQALLDRTLESVKDEPKTPFEITPDAFQMPLNKLNASWLVTVTLSLVDHLVNKGALLQIDDDPARYVAA